MRFDVKEKYGEIHIHKTMKRDKGTYDKDYIDNIINNYKWILKTTHKFTISKITNDYTLHASNILTNNDYTELIEFLNKFETLKFLDNTHSSYSLFKIKDKIDFL